jgi:hypothetical protein
MKLNIWTMSFCATVCIALATAMAAQVQTQTTVQHGAPVQTVQVDRAEVVYAAGNDLVLKLDDGRIAHVAVPEGITMTADGRQLTVRDLKPGMKLQRTITTTETPTTITTVKTVEGTVFHVSPPNFVNLTLADGTTQRFRIPSGQRFNVDGRETDAFGLRKGMKVSATSITEVAGLVSAREVERTAQVPSFPATGVPPGSALLIVVNGPLASDYKEDFHMSGRCH